MGPLATCERKATRIQKFIYIFYYFILSVYPNELISILYFEKFVQVKVPCLVFCILFSGIQRGSLSNYNSKRLVLVLQECNRITYNSSLFTFQSVSPLRVYNCSRFHVVSFFFLSFKYKLNILLNRSEKVKFLFLLPIKYCSKSDCVIDYANS